MKKLRAWFAEEKHRVLKVAVGFWFTAHALDFISTALALAFVPGVTESNVFGIHPVTGDISWGGLVFIKIFYDSLMVAFPALAIYLATKRSDIAAVMFAYNGYTILDAAGQNFSLLFLYIRIAGGF